MSKIEVWKITEDKRINDAINELLNAVGDFSRREALEHGMTMEEAIRTQHESLLSVIESLVKGYRAKLEHGIRAVMGELEKLEKTQDGQE